jgi:hypothetical protein
MALSFEAKKIALKQDRTGFVLTLAMHPDEVPEEILRDFVGARYAVAIQRIADDESPVPYNNRVQKAGMICRDPDFQTFLVATNLSNEEGEDGAAEGLCKYCRIESRSELNGNKKAQEKFDELINVFIDWKNNESF